MTAFQSYIQPNQGTYIENLTCPAIDCQNMVIQSQTVNGDFNVNDTLANTTVASIAVNSDVNNVPLTPLQGISLNVAHPVGPDHIHSSIFIGDASALGGPTNFAVMEWMNDTSLPSAAAARVVVTGADPTHGTVQIQAADNNAAGSTLQMDPATASLASPAITLNSTSVMTLTGYGGNAHPIGASSYDILVVDSAGLLKSTPGNVGGGAYSATISNLSNLTNVSTTKAIFSQSGNSVSVVASFLVTPTAALNPISFQMSLPVPLSGPFGDGFSALGQATFGDPATAATIGGNVFSVTGAQTVLITVSATGVVVADTLVISFSYLLF